MIVSPIGLLNEAEALRYQKGIYNPFDLLTVDPRALCVTPFHGIASRLKELARGKNSRGTVGYGVGEAYRYSQRFPELTIRAGELSHPDLKNRLAEIRKQIICDLETIIHGEFLPEDQQVAEKEIETLYDDGLLNYVTGKINAVSQLANIVDEEYMQREILTRDGVVVVESSHGILTDHYHGFAPHTSAIRTLPCFTHQMLEEAGYTGQIINLGVTRAYAIRHGAGPIPTDDPTMAENLLPGSSKEDNRYQGKARVGPMDLVLLRYAIEVCGGPTAFDGLAITWFDQIQNNGVWHLCDSYSSTAAKDFFKPTGEIKVRRGADEEQIRHQETLTQQLFRCQPIIRSIPISKSASREELFSLCANEMRCGLGVPARMVSFGPTEVDKMFR